MMSKSRCQTPLKEVFHGMDNWFQGLHNSFRIAEWTFRGTPARPTLPNCHQSGFWDGEKIERTTIFLQSPGSARLRQLSPAWSAGAEQILG